MGFWEGERCEYCGGPITERRVCLHRQSHRKHVLIEDVPAGVCTRCGARYYSANVLKTLQEIVRVPRRPFGLVGVMSEHLTLQIDPRRQTLCIYLRPIGAGGVRRTEKLREGVLADFGDSGDLPRRPASVATLLAERAKTR